MRYGMLAANKRVMGAVPSRFRESRFWHERRIVRDDFNERKYQIMQQLRARQLNQRIFLLDLADVLRESVCVRARALRTALGSTS